MLKGVPEHVSPVFELLTANIACESTIILRKLHLLVETRELFVLPHPVFGDVGAADGALDLVKTPYLSYFLYNAYKININRLKNNLRNDDFIMVR